MTNLEFNSLGKKAVITALGQFFQLPPGQLPPQTFQFIEAQKGASIHKVSYQVLGAFELFSWG